MMSEDVVLRACTEYVRRTGKRPCYANVAPVDFAAVQFLLRDSLDPTRQQLVIGPYRLTLAANNATLPGALLVSAEAIRAEARPAEIRALQRQPMHGRLRPGGVITHQD